jgi:hypothetical protein
MEILPVAVLMGGSHGRSEESGGKRHDGALMAEGAQSISRRCSRDVQNDVQMIYERMYESWAGEGINKPMELLRKNCGSQSTFVLRTG